MYDQSELIGESLSQEALDHCINTLHKKVTKIQKVQGSFITDKNNIVASAVGAQPFSLGSVLFFTLHSMPVGGTKL